MKARITQLTSAPFLRSVVKLSGAQLFAIALPLLAAPVLGRLYLPADYGALALFMAAANVLGVAAAFQMQQAIIAERTVAGARALVWLCIALSMGVATLVFATLALFTLFGRAPNWFWLLPAIVLLGGLAAGVSTMANRHKRYGDLARIQVMSVTATVAGSVLLGLLGWGRSGLFIGYAVGQVIVLINYLRLYRILMAPPRRPSANRMMAMARRHRRFAMFTLPGEVLGTLNLQMPVFALGWIGAEALLGAFSRARRLVEMPIALFGGAVGQVFRQEAAERFRASGNCRPLYLRTTGTLFAMGLIPCAVFMVFAPSLFVLYLGPNWAEAGQAAQILAPMLLMRLAVSPVSVVFQITGHQRTAFLLSLVSVCLVAIGVLGPIATDSPPIWIVAGFSIAYGLIYGIYAVAGWRVSAR